MSGAEALPRLNHKADVVWAMFMTPGGYDQKASNGKRLETRHPHRSPTRIGEGFAMELGSVRDHCGGCQGATHALQVGVAEAIEVRLEPHTPRGSHGRRTRRADFADFASEG